MRFGVGIPASLNRTKVCRKRENYPNMTSQVNIFQRDELRHSIHEGIFSTVFGTLTGGVFLTGFALHLGMNEFMIGLLASFPFLATIFQLPASYWIERLGKRKRIAVLAAGTARLSWVPIVLFALWLRPASAGTCWIVLCMMFVLYAFVAVSYVAWLSWMSDLVPENIRGTFFGTRNMFNGIAGLLALLVFGNVLDFFKGTGQSGTSIGLSITFLAAALLGMMSLHFLGKIPESPLKTNTNNRKFFHNLAEPFRTPNFRKFAVFSFFWSFSVYFASPFITLYMLRELGLSYSFAASLGVMSALADLVGMRLWGRISDKVKNKPVVVLMGWMAAFLPLAWATARPGIVLIPIVLNLLGGGLWSGITLCTGNMLLRISPKENRTFYLSVYNIMGGIGATLGPILAGLTLTLIKDVELNVFSFKAVPLHLIFLASTAFRILSLLLLRRVSEPEEATVGRLIRVLRSVRGLNVATGFSFMLHPFIEISRGSKRQDSERSLGV